MLRRQGVPLAVIAMAAEMRTMSADVWAQFLTEIGGIRFPR